MKDLQAIPIKEDPHKIASYIQNDFCQMVLDMFEAYYPKVGFRPPWIGYFFMDGESVVGTGGYKGPPGESGVEVSYGVVPAFERRGYGTSICRHLVEMASEEKPELRIFARTLMEENASTKILKRNGFQWVGIVNDLEDGDVWEWVYEPGKNA